MKKNIVTIITGIMTAALLAGCSGAKDSSDLAGKLAQVKEGVKTEEAAEKPAEEPEEPAQETQDDNAVVPTLILHRVSTGEWDESNSPIIRHRYSYITLEKEQEDELGGLADSLNGAMDEILSKEKKAFDDDKKGIEENPAWTFDESWLSYVRRADSRYVSILNEYCTEGQFDDGYYTEYTAHNYHTGSGKEIEFSEVVADEDAFYDLMSDKVYSYASYAFKNKYMDDIDLDKDKVKDDLKEYMKTGKLAWTLDSQGVSFYINAYTMLAEGFSETIQFCEDTDNKIFAPEFSKDVPDTWVTQIPQYAGSYIDLTGSGVGEYVCANELYEMKEYEGSEEFYISGLHIDCSGESENAMTTMPGATDYHDVFLLHMNDSTVLLEAHNEYDQSFINTFKLGRHMIEAADSKRACLEWPSQKNYDIDGEGYIPVIIPTDPAKIRVMAGEGEYSGDWAPDAMSVDKDGKITFASGVLGDVDIDGAAGGSGAGEGSSIGEGETIPEYLLYVKSSDGYANLRTGPGTEYDVICQIPNGKDLEVYREDPVSKNGKNWIKVAYFTEADNEDGYEWLTGWIAESQVE